MSNYSQSRKNAESVEQMTKAPCKECDNHSDVCHAICLAYKEYEKIHKEERAAINKAKHKFNLGFGARWRTEKRAAAGKCREKKAKSQSFQTNNEIGGREMDNGTVTIGVDYYTDIVREHAIMEANIRQLKRFLKEERTSRMVYITNVAQIFGFNVEEVSDDE